jgi:hypothetical protein
VKPSQRSTIDDHLGLPGPFDPAEVEDLWFLPPDDPDGEADALSMAKAKPSRASLVDAAGWRAAEARLAGEMAELSFDLGRLAERVRMAGQGAVQRLALEEAAALSWWTGDRMGADRLALWTSYRIGASEEDGGGLIRTAWAARRLAAAAAAGQGSGLAGTLAAALGEEGRADPGLIADAAAELEPLAGCSAVTRGAALFHLWRSLDERPDHLRGLEAVVLGARIAGQGALPFLPLALTGFGALTTSGGPEARLAGWISGAHRAVLSALMVLDRLSGWRTRAEAETADLFGRTPLLLIAALAAHPMLAAPQAEAETGTSRAAVQRNLDLLQTRGLIREVTGQGRFRVWAAKV